MQEKFKFHHEATPDKTFEELINLFNQTGLEKIALTKNNEITHLMTKGHNTFLDKDFFKMIFMENFQTVSIHENFLKLSPESISDLYLKNDIKPSQTALDILGKSNLVFEDKESALKLLDILLSHEDNKTRNFFSAQEPGEIKSFILGEVEVKETLLFHERFGRFPLNSHEVLLVSNERAFDDLVQAGFANKIYVFKEKVLVVKNGVVNIGPYQVVVPNDIAELKNSKITSLVFKKEEDVSINYTNFGNNFFWNLPIKTASDYLSTILCLNENSVSSIGLQILSGITQIERTFLTSTELNVLKNVFSKYKIRNVRINSSNSGLVFTTGDNKRFGYEKGNLKFVLATGRLPKPSEAKNVKTNRSSNHEMER